MEALIQYFGCGIYKARSVASAGDFFVSNFSDIFEKILPFFGKYPLQGAKAKDLADFRRAAEIIKVKGHLTEEGFKELGLLKTGMNAARSGNNIILAANTLLFMMIILVTANNFLLMFVGQPPFPANEFYTFYR